MFLNTLCSSYQGNLFKYYIKNLVVMNSTFRYHTWGLTRAGRMRQSIQPEHLELLRGKKVVDAGCSLGYTTNELSQIFNTTVIGIDIDYQRIEEARESGRRGKFRVADGYFLSKFFKQNSQDSIFMMSNLYIAMSGLNDEKLAEILGNSAKVLSHNGHLCIGSDENYVIFRSLKNKLSKVASHSQFKWKLEKVERLEKIALQI
jgi:SAM-dependent methyltransferase